MSGVWPSSGMYTFSIVFVNSSCRCLSVVSGRNKGFAASYGISSADSRCSRTGWEVSLSVSVEICDVSGSKSRVRGWVKNDPSLSIFDSVRVFLAWYSARLLFRCLILRRFRSLACSESSSAWRSTKESRSKFSDNCDEELAMFSAINSEL